MEPNQADATAVTDPRIAATEPIGVLSQDSAGGHPGEGMRS